MKTHPFCIPCLLKRCLFEAMQVDTECAHPALLTAVAELNESYEEGTNSAWLATRVHRKVYEALGTNDPYAELKRKSRDVVKALLPRARAMLEGADDRLRTAVMLSICGNLLDFGAAGQMNDTAGFEEAFERIVHEGLGIDDLERTKKYLKNEARVLFLTDNAGEIMLDRLLIEEIATMGCRVTVMVKGVPVLNDATMDDALDAGLDGVARLTDTGMFAVGVDLDRADEKVREEFQRADIIISKGMANWESLSDVHPTPICYILRAKCEPVANSIGARKDDNIVRLFDD